MAKDQNEVTVTRRVKIITPKARYSNIPFHYAIPQSKQSRQFLTGQNEVVLWDVKKVSAANGGEETVFVPNKDITKLSASDRRLLQMGDNPYIINPGDPILIIHGYEYDNSYRSIVEKDGDFDKEVERVYLNAKDHAEITAILSWPDSPVAKSKSDYVKNKHHFYVDDKEVEAQKQLDKDDMEYEAQEYVRKDLGTGRYPEMVLFLGYMIPEYNIKPGLLSDTRMKALINKACKEHPATVLKYKGPNGVRYVFVLQLIQKGIIVVDHNLNYKYGDMHLGVNIDSVIEWMSDMKRNGTIVTKWQKMLDLAAESSANVNLD